MKSLQAVLFDLLDQQGLLIRVALDPGQPVLDFEDGSGLGTVGSEAVTRIIKAQSGHALFGSARVEIHAQNTSGRVMLVLNFYRHRPGPVGPVQGQFAAHLDGPVLRYRRHLA